MRGAGAERGSGTLEVVGVVTVAAILVAALLLAIVTASPVVRDRIAQAICQIVTFGQGECGSVELGLDEGRPPEDYVPPDPCVLLSQGLEGSLGVSAGVVSLGEGRFALVEQLSDGTVRVTFGEDKSGGVNAGIGAEAGVVIDGTRWGSGAWLAGDILATMSTGNVYYADDMDTALEILQQEAASTVKDNVMGPGGPVRGAFDWLQDQASQVVPFVPPATQHEPDEWFVEAGLEASGDARIMSLTGAAGVDAAIGGYVGTTMRRDGTSTAHFKVTAEGTASAHFLGNEAAASGQIDGIVEVDFDAHGNPVMFRLRQGYVGDAYVGGSDTPVYHEFTHEIPLHSHDDLAHVMRTTGMYGAGVVASGPNGFVLTASALSEISRLAGEDGYIYRDEYLLDGTEHGVFANVGIKVNGGFDAGIELTERDLIGRTHWDGAQWVDTPGC